MLNPVHRLNETEFKLEPRSNKLLEKMCKLVSEEYEFITLKNIMLPVDYSKSLAAPERVMDIYCLIKKGAFNLKSDYYAGKKTKKDHCGHHHSMKMIFDTPLFLNGFGRCITYELLYYPDGYVKERKFM